MEQITTVHVTIETQLTPIKLIARFTDPLLWPSQTWVIFSPLRYALLQASCLMLVD